LAEDYYMGGHHTVPLNFRHEFELIDAGPARIPS